MTTELSTTANAEYALADKAKDDAITHARLAGEALIKAKGNLAHGEWLAWVANHWDYQPRQAQACMQLARNWQALPNTQRHAHLNLSDALKLLAKPKPAKPPAPEPAQQPPSQPQPPSEPPQAPTSADQHLVSMLENDVEEWREKAVQAERERDAVKVANSGADQAAKRIVALEQENAALKQDVARLQEEVGRWKHKCKQLAGAKS